MIGVIPKPGQTAAVEEFFELFKTPWEYCRAGRSYDVAIITDDSVPTVDATVVLICGAGRKNGDAERAFVAAAASEGGSFDFRDTRVPVYGSLATFAAGTGQRVCLQAGGAAAGVRVNGTGSTVIRLGYDVFDEVRFLLENGQPVERALIPTLDLHIAVLRELILDAGVSIVEIPPTPSGYSFVACLTHDIDFVGIREHRFDHTMWGFLYRSTVGALRNVVRGRLTISRLLQTWRAVAALPFVYLGWAKDFWSPFEWYLEVEKGLPATYFLIPFRNRPGENVAPLATARRGTKYDVNDIADSCATLLAAGCELGVHGIDAWHSPARGREEAGRITAVTGASSVGIRMHWLLRDARTFEVLDQAGYAYDSTVGYNEAIGYRAGTSQVFRPFGTKTLLELPMHIQDGALFFSERLDLPEPEAWNRCERLLRQAREIGGVLTLLWHDRSHGPERFWGGFYARLVGVLRRSGVWFGSAAQVVGWFRQRREVRFEQSHDPAHGGIRVVAGAEIDPPLVVRVHRSVTSFVDVPWNGRTPFDVAAAAGHTSTGPAIALSIRQ